MLKDFIRNFTIIGAVIIWAIFGLDMIASVIVPPASEKMCGEYPLWCFYSHHPSFGILGFLMVLTLLAAFATFLFSR